MGVTRKPVGGSAKRKAPAKRKPVAKQAPEPKIKRTRSKKLRLTIEEKRLLEYPPTEKTWKCACDAPNAGSSTICWVCRGKRTKKLLWPIYVGACKKVEIEPGDQWKIIDRMRNICKVKRKGRGVWVEHPLPEGYTLP